MMTLGSIGNDNQAEWIEESLNKEKLGYDVYKCDKATGQCAVTVVKADRTCVAVLDACEEYPISHLKSIIDKPESTNFLCFYTTGFFISTNYEALMLMAKYAFEQNRIFGYCFASEEIYDKNKEQTLEIMEYSDYLFCNKQEAISATKHIGPEIGISRDETDLLKIAGALASYKKQN